MVNIMNLTKMSINNLTAGFKNLGLVFGIWLLVSIVSPSFLGMVFAMSGYLFMNQVMGYEDTYGIDNLIATLPVKRSEYVISRYILGITISLSSIAILTLIYFTINTINPIEIPIEMLVTIGLLSSIVTISMIIPVVIKFGMNKAKVINMLMFLLIMAIATGVMQTINTDKEFIINIINKLNNIGLPMIVTVVSMVVVSISMIISLKIYSNKEVK
ncbi:ABC-2 transporter permease [Paraclostridium bifermentans]|uniref:ABC-2 transporter permease n=1 Tax=Paraclostridium bifermentans TaxID=1490 RepID=UPI00359C9C5B